MKIIQITPGAGGMYCGNCFRDNAMVAEFRRNGHDACLLPLYLPMTLDEEDQSRGMPIFFSGINVYLDQAFPLFRKSPEWVHRLFSSTRLLKMAARFAGKTRASELGDLTFSMLQGDHGNQARELADMVSWLKQGPKPDILCLSNALLSGFAKPIQDGLGVPVACMLQGEDGFLDSLNSPWKERCWEAVAKNLSECAQLIAPSHYFAGLMSGRLKIPLEEIRIVSNGINPEGYRRSACSSENPVLGYFARLCPDKGLDILVDAFIALRKRGTVGGVRLKLGGGLGPSDQAYVQALKRRIADAGLEADVTWSPNLDRDGKIDFLETLTLFSVPARYSEAFGLYLLEAMAAGVPVVQPRHAAFTELIRDKGIGATYDPKDPQGLVDALEKLLLEPSKLRGMAQAAHDLFMRDYTVTAMCGRMIDCFRAVSL